MTFVINQGMAMYWGTSRWSAMEIMVTARLLFSPYKCALDAHLLTGVFLSLAQGSVLGRTPVQSDTACV